MNRCKMSAQCGSGFFATIKEDSVGYNGRDFTAGFCFHVTELNMFVMEQVEFNGCAAQHSV